MPHACRSKMYKARLKKWGFSKYILTKAEDLASLPNLLGEGEHRGAVRLVSGRVVDVDRLTSHLLRKKTPAAAAAHRGHHWAVPAPSLVAMAIKPPDVLHISEAVLTETRIYVSGQMTEVFSDFGELAINSTFYASRGLLRSGKVDEAVALLRQAPRQMMELLRYDSPGILDSLFMILAHLHDISGERLAKTLKALVRYAAAAAADLGWPLHHPLRRILIGFANLNEQDALAQYDLATRSWRLLLEMIDAELGTPGCSVNFCRWLDLGESSGYDVLPGAYLEQRQWGVYQAKVAEFGEGSVEAVRELFFLTELERQKVAARGTSNARLQYLFELTLRSIPEGTGLTAKYNCQLYLAEIYKEQGRNDLAEELLRASIHIARTRADYIAARCLALVVKLEGWLVEWGEDAKAAELQPLKASLLGEVEEADP